MVWVDFLVYAKSVGKKTDENMKHVIGGEN